MRLIVVGPIVTQGGIQQLNVWFRFPVIVARQPYYTRLQASSQPTAPGDYAGADATETSDFQAGRYTERAGFFDVIDPTASLATIQTRLVNIYTAAASASKAFDDAELARWGSSYDGTSWSMKTA